MPYVPHNPFPGVNPYIEAEQFWDDFHNRFLTYLSDELLASLPAAYDVLIEERIVTSRTDAEASITRTQYRHSDVAIVEKADAPTIDRGATGSAGAAVADAIELEIVEFDEERVKSLGIRRLGEDELITSIELLSPSNKVGIGYEEFTAKRRELFAAGVNTIDLDLLRDGRRLAFNSPLPARDYFAFVTRPKRSRKAECYAWTLRDRLPAIRVPLAQGDPDIICDLAKPYAEMFIRGGYPRRLRYERPLHGVDAATNDWAKSLIDAGAS